MEKVPYEEPTTKTFFVKIESPLLTASGVDATRDSYGTATGVYDQLWD